MINPWAVLILVLSIGCIVVAWKGTQDNVLSAILGRPYGTNTLSTASGGATVNPQLLDPAAAGTGLVPGLPN